MGGAALRGVFLSDTPGVVREEDPKEWFNRIPSGKGQRGGHR